MQRRWDGGWFGRGQGHRKFAGWAWQRRVLEAGSAFLHMQMRLRMVNLRAREREKTEPTCTGKETAKQWSFVFYKRFNIIYEQPVNSSRSFVLSPLKDSLIM